MRDERTVNTAAAPDATGITGCPACAGYGRPGYVAHWIEDAGRMRHTWRRCPERCTPMTRAAAIARQQQRHAEQQSHPPQPAPTTPPTAAPSPQPPARPAPASPRRTRQAPASTRRGAARRPARRGPALLAAVALDVDGSAVTADVDGVAAPGAKTLDALLRWIASGPALGIAAQHDDGRRHNGVVALSSAYAKALKLPAKLPEPGKRAALEKRLHDAADAAGVDLGQHLSARIAVMPRRAAGVRRAPAVTLVVTPWLGQSGGAPDAADANLSALADGGAGTLARRLRLVAQDLGVPVTSGGRTALTLLDSVRPRETWIGDGKRELKPGALPAGDVCVPPAAGGRHPLTDELLNAGRAPCRENDYSKWQRALVPEEEELPYAVGVDVSTSHLSVTATLPLPVGPLEHTTRPTFDKKTAGLWWCDFSGLETEELLPHPATKSGQRPEGPQWYATPTVAYMVTEYGYDPAEITEAYVSTHTAALLKEWTAALREGYKRRTAVLGITDDMPPAAFLDAYSRRAEGAEEDEERADALALVELYKAIYRAGTGKWADRGGQYTDDADWLREVVASWHYRPEIRLHIVAAARIGTHRRVRKTWKLTGRAPFAANVDGLLYACEEPSPLPLFTHDEKTGKPVPGTIRLGAAPGSVKHDKTIPMDAVRAAFAEGRPMNGGGGLAGDYDTAGLVEDEEDQEVNGRG